MSFTASYIDSWLRVSAAIDAVAIDRAVEILAEARDRDAMVWTLGNGGCNALASHLAIGLTLNTLRVGGRPFRAVCLGADAAALSAATNDFGGDDAMRAILECSGRSGDVLCAFSVSGESTNVNRALIAAREMEMTVIALVGGPESTTARLSDHRILLGSVEPGIAEDVGSVIMHSIYCSFMYEDRESLPREFEDAG
jgi:D-sedoheptulose 7-phosphate isomerase